MKGPAAGQASHVSLLASQPAINLNEETTSRPGQFYVSRNNALKCIK